MRLAKICAEVEKETSIKIIPIVQAADVARIANLGIEVWSQADFASGAAGVLLNHSDNKLSVSAVGEAVGNADGYKTLVCCKSIEEGKQIADFKPDFLAYEPPELIGRASPKAVPAARGDISVSMVKAEIVRDFVRQISGIPIIIGAGIHAEEDIRKGLKLGAKGFLVSSAVVESDDPKSVLLNLAKGFHEAI